MRFTHKWLKPQKKLEKKFVFPFGLSGGFLGAMFGSGGFFICDLPQWTNRNPRKNPVTQTTLIGCSTVFRVILFTTAGVFFG